MYKAFGVTIADPGLRGAADLIQASLRLPQSQLVVTANPEILVYARRHPDYRTVLEQSGLVLPDGIGVVLASYLTKTPIVKGRVPGVDLVELLVSESGRNGYSLYFIGNSDLQKATQYFSLKYSNIRISGYNTGPTFSADEGLPLTSEVNDGLIADIILKKPDIILVGFGHPKQERWLNYYLPKLPVKVGIGVGGSFDYFSGRARRAPRLFRSLGLEWLWRLCVEPSRFLRILVATVVFPFYLLKDSILQMFHVEQS
jgi:N-acetylglucosaminyldiphosphoundecaprenol N-acetyl-beta-D-mannosaminyltransferase